MTEPVWLERLEATRPYQRLRYGMNRGLVNFFRQTVFAGRNELRLAEVACGSGYAAHLLAQEENVILSLAMDLNLDDYRQANIQGFRASFMLMDMFHPSVLAGSMDFVWNSSSIEEIDEPQKAVAAMAWLAKPGGWVFVGVPNKYGPAGWLRLLPSWRTHVWLGRVYDRKELNQLLESANLQVKREISYFFGVFIGALAQKLG